MRRKKCQICRVLTANWERVDGQTRCWPCGRAARGFSSYDDANPDKFEVAK